jgi:hypothetical protein
MVEVTRGVKTTMNLENKTDNNKLEWGHGKEFLSIFRHISAR